LINILGFNAVWFGLVYFGDKFIPVALLYILVHLIFFAKKNSEAKYLLLISIIGIAIDSILHFFEIFIFVPNNHIPLWLACLWFCFSTTIFHSLRFLERAVWLQLIAGFLAPFSYFAGNKLGAVMFGKTPFFTYTVLAITWSVLFVFFFYLKRNFELTQVKNLDNLRSDPHV
jgi:hypothetical protein